MEGKRHMERMQLDNSGFTLIEIIIAATLSSFIILSVGYFMVHTTTQYNFTENQSVLQLEAQTIVNHVFNRIVEANNVHYDDATNRLTIFHMDLPDPAGDGSIQWTDPDTLAWRQIDIIWYDEDNGEMYLYVVSDDAEYEAALQDIGDETRTTEDRFPHLIGQFVEGFECTADDTGLDANLANANTRTNTVGITVRMERNNLEYALSNEASLRNIIMPIPTAFR